MRITIPAVLAAAVLATAAPAAPPVSAEKVTRIAQENASALRGYTWKTRLDMRVDEEAQLTRLFRVRYDEHGTLRTASLDPEPEPAKWWAVRGRVKKKRARELADWAARLTERVTSYTAPSSGQMLDFYSRARPTPGADFTRFRALGFLTPGDTATFWVDPRTGRANRFGFATTLDDVEVVGEVEYGVLDDGTRYAARITVDVPAKQVHAVIETFDYERN